MPNQPLNPYIAGIAVGGKRGFFGRQDIFREVERTLSRPDDNAIVLYGQRRIGKTSILLQLKRYLPSPPFVPIYFDLMDMARLPINEVLCELAKTIAQEVHLAPSQVEFEQNQDTFQRVFLPLVYQTLGDEYRPVLLLDEFDVLDLIGERNLPETAAARTFRPYLRRLLTTEPRLAFVFVVGRRMDELSVEFLSTFKAAATRLVSPLPLDEARTLILQAERNGALRYDPPAVDRILALTRGHPYLTQLTCQILFDRAFDQPLDETPLITIKDVEDAIPRVLDAGNGVLEWIWDGLPPAERIIFSAIASQTKEGSVFSENDIAAVLREAGIRILMRELNLAPQTLVDWQMLEQVDGGYRFYIEFLRRWVATNKPLKRVKDELDRINPLADTLYQAAQSFYQNNNNEQAKAQLRQALMANPNHLKAHLLLGTILREENELNPAIAEFEKAYELDPRDGRFELLRTLLLHGEALEAADNEEEALTIYNRVLAISPHEQTAQVHRAALWEKRGDRALAVSDFETAGEAYRQAGANEKLAQAKAQQLRTELAQAAKEAEGYEAQKEWGKALDVYRRLTQLDPDDERWLEAIKRVEEEIWLAERYAEGAGYIRQQEWQKAQAILAKVIHKRPDYRDAAELLALATTRSRGQRDPRHEQRRRLYLIVAGGIILLLLVVVGMWEYNQIQDQAQATSMTATAIAQATAAEAMAATRVAGAVQGTRLAEFQATQTVQAQTATLPTETIDTNTTIYDNFSNPEYDGSFNPVQWTYLGDTTGKVMQENGILMVSQMGKQNNGTALDSKLYNQSISTPTFFEAKLKVDNPQNAHAFLFVGSDLSSTDYSDCTLGYGDTQASINCGYVTLGDSTFRSKDRFVDFETWHTVRVEVDPLTMTFTYYIDNEAIGSYTSPNADKLKNARFSLNVGIFSSSSDKVVGYIDDVRIGKIQTSLTTPQPISTSTPTIGADLLVYDNFDNPANEGSYDKGLWNLLPGASPSYKVAQQNGAMMVTQQGKAEEGTSLVSRQYTDLLLTTPTFFEAKLMLDPETHVGNVQMHVNWYEAGKEGWFSDCNIDYYEQAFVSCWDTLWPPTAEHTYNVEGQQVELGTWHTVRIEVDPATMTFTYYIDGQKVGSHVPVDAEKLKKSKFEFTIGVWGSSTDFLTGYVDDVRVGPVEDSAVVSATATSIPTDTPKPESTSEVTPTIVTDPLMYDDFNNPANEGSYNKSLWELWLNVSTFQVAQQSGEMMFTQETTLDNGTNLAARQYSDFLLYFPIFFEAKLKLSSDNHAGNVQLNLGVNSELSAGQMWFAQCSIDGNGSESKPSANCYDTVWPPQDGHGYDLGARAKQVDYDTWHTFRIEVDPATMTFTYYIDDEQLGSHIPIDAEKLKNIRFYQTIGIHGSNVTGFVDDNRIGRVVKQ